MECRLKCARTYKTLAQKSDRQSLFYYSVATPRVESLNPTRVHDMYLPYPPQYSLQYTSQIEYRALGEGLCILRQYTAAR